MTLGDVRRIRRDVLNITSPPSHNKCEEYHHHGCFSGAHDNTLSRRLDTLQVTEIPRIRLKKLNVNVKLLCDISTQIWIPGVKYPDVKDIDDIDMQERHDVFLNYLGHCINTGKNDRISANSDPTVFKHLSSTPTIASTSKIKCKWIDRDLAQNQININPAPKIADKKMKNEETFFLPSISIGGNGFVSQIDINSSSKRSTLVMDEKIQFKSNEKKEDELYKILRKSQYDRTNKDIQKMFHMLRHLQAFEKLPDFVLSQLCGIFSFTELEENKIIFRQGEQGSSWFVILSGKVHIWIDQASEGAPNQKKSILVSKLSVGQGFGELALVKDQARAATVITHTPCKLLRVEKSDYLRILRFIHENESKEKLLLLRKISIFEDLDDIILASIANVMIVQYFPNKSIALKQGDKLNRVYFIKKGRCSVKAVFHDTDLGKDVSVDLGCLEVGDYYGEITAIAHDTKDLTSPFTITCIGDVQIGYLQSYQARAKMGKELRITKLWETATDIDKLKGKIAEIKDKKAWNMYKSKVLKSLLQNCQKINK